MNNVIMKHLYPKSPTICTCEVASAASFKYDIKPPLACMKSSAPHSVTVAGRTQMPLCERTVFISTFVYVYSHFSFISKGSSCSRSHFSLLSTQGHRNRCVFIVILGQKSSEFPLAFHL